MEPDAPLPIRAETPAQSIDQQDTQELVAHNISYPSTPLPQILESQEYTLFSSEQEPTHANNTAAYIQSQPTNPQSPSIGRRENESFYFRAIFSDITTMATHMLPIYRTQANQAQKRLRAGIDRRKAIPLILMLCIIVFQTLSLSTTQIIGSHGWNYLLYGSDNSNNTAELEALTHPTSKLASNGSARLTPQQYINLIINKMSLDQKIGQMMMVQFVGPTYSTDLDTMIKQYHIGEVLLFTANGNIVNKTQLSTLTKQIQAASTLPMGIATDQEGGAVDRLVNLDGPEPSEATIGQSNDPTQAKNVGAQVANDMASYGININLAPVVDVDTNSASELHLDGRTYGTTPATVTQMAGAYLQGLQQSHKVIGTLKHFPGLGSVTTDPHLGLPTLSRSKNELEQIDWAPYTQLIKSGQVHAIMVTHEIVPAIDPSTPASLSPKLVTDVLRKEMGFQGVIMTDSLTMDSIAQYYTPAQAAAAAVIAGSDIIMGANSANDAATMIEGITQAITDGTITQARIDQSVQRILMMKYQLGLLPIPTN